MTLWRPRRQSLEYAIKWNGRPSNGERRCRRIVPTWDRKRKTRSEPPEEKDPRKGRPIASMHRLLCRGCAGAADLSHHRCCLRTRENAFEEVLSLFWTDGRRMDGRTNKRCKKLQRAVVKNVQQRRRGKRGRNNYRSASLSLLSGPQFHLRPILDCGEARKKGLLWLVAQEIRCDPFRLETGQDGRAKSGKGPEELLWGAAFILSNLSQCEWLR